MDRSFSPPRGGRGSQSKADNPVPSAFWQPPEETTARDFWPYKAGAIFLGWVDGKPIGIKEDRHLLTVAGARAGKTSTLLIPNLHLYGGAAIVLDPKGELATATAVHRAKELGHSVHVLDPWGVAEVPPELRARFDPLADLLATHKADTETGRLSSLVDDVSLLCEAIIEDSGDGKNKHWTDSARDLLRGLILWQMFAAPDEYRGLHRLPKILAESMASDKEAEEADDLFSALVAYSGEDDIPEAVADLIRTCGQGMLNTPKGERASIISTARNQLGFLESPQMADSLAASSFKLGTIKRGAGSKPAYSVTRGDTITPARPVTVYLCLPASRMGTHAKWLRLFLNMAMAALERDKFKPALPVLLMLEEFAALGHMRALEQAAAYMAGFSVRMWIVLQDLTQLKRHYREGWETFIGNAGCLTAFGNSDQTTLDYLSKRLGDTFVYLTETQQIGSNAAASGAASMRENFQKVPLLAPDELARHFGRRHMRCLALVADAPPIAIDRRHLTSAELTAIAKGNANG